MEKTFKNYLKLFSTTFSLSAFTLGGGYVIIPLMKKKFVDDLAWLEEEEMLNMASIAQSSPGAMAVNASILVGWRVMGFSGALVSILGTVLPPLIILSIISHFYNAFRNNVLISAALKGMMAGVCAVIFDVVLNMGEKIIRAKKALPLCILAAAFLAHFVLHVNVVFIILCCGLVGALVGLRNAKTGKEHL